VRHGSPLYRWRIERRGRRRDHDAPARGHVTEAQAYADLNLPPLRQTLEKLCEELSEPEVIALGVRERSRLVGAVRLRHRNAVVELGRLTVAPDRQGSGIGTFPLGEAETVFPHIQEIRLFTGGTIPCEHPAVVAQRLPRDSAH